MKYTIPYKKLRNNARPPVKKHILDAGWDISVSSIKTHDDGQLLTYGCGLAFDFSSVGWAEVFARSSVYKHGMILSNGVGVIDGNYRGEVSGVFYVFRRDASIYTYGDRFLQIVLPEIKIEDEVEFVLVPELKCSDRGAGGYGSTGDK